MICGHGNLLSIVSVRGEGCVGLSLVEPSGNPERVTGIRSWTSFLVISRAPPAVIPEHPVGTPCKCTPYQPTADGVGDDEQESYQLATANGISEDVKHVMTIVGKRERVNDGVVLDYGYRRRHCEEQIQCPDDELCVEELFHK